MNKKLIVAAMVVPILLASGIAASAYVYSGCKYNSITGNYVFEGKVYAHGTMEDAWDCAIAGLLPKLIITRLGGSGDERAREEARKIIEKNEEVKEKNKEKVKGV